MPANPTPAEGVVVPFVSPTCGGERCFCGAAAVRKVGEEIPRDDPSYRRRHNYTAYVCAEHFAMILGPAAARSVGHAARPAAPTQSAAQTGEVLKARVDTLVNILAPDQGESLSEERRRLFAIASAIQSDLHALSQREPGQ